MYNSSGMYNSMCIYIYLYVRTVYFTILKLYIPCIVYIPITLIYQSTSRLPEGFPWNCHKMTICKLWHYHTWKIQYIYIHICNIPFHPIIIPNDYPMNISWFHGYPSYPVKLRMFVATSPSRSSRATRTLRSPACPGAPPCAMAPSPPPRSNSVMGGGRVRQKVVMETYNVGAPSYKLVYRHQ